MKKIFSTAMAIALAVLCATGFGIASCKNETQSLKNGAYAPVNKNASPEAKALLAFLYQQRGKGLLTGQHSYPLYSDVFTERVENLTGEHPAVYGQDFGYSKMGSLDGINFRQRVVDNAIKWYQKGAIITLMWHSVPPTQDEFFTEWQGDQCIQSKLTDEQWKELLTEGTELNNRWKTQVDVVAFFLKQLQYQNIPVIWRPYHEMNGSWFWWGQRPGKGGYEALYRMLYDRLTNYHKLNNLLWVFNANELGSSNVGDYKDFYPGDDVVDILATDIYHSEFKGSDYELLAELGKGKIVAWGEVGKMPTEDDVKKHPNMSWFMTWCEFLEKDNTWQEANDIYKSNLTITLDELNKIRK